MQDRTWEVSGGHKFSLRSWYGKKKAFRGWSKFKSGGWQALANSSDPWRTEPVCEEPMGYPMVLHLKLCRINFFPQLIIVFIDVFCFHCYPLKTSLITIQKWSDCSFVLVVVRQAGLVSTIYHHFVNGRLSQKKQIFKTWEIGQINGRLLSFSNFSVL